MKKIIRPLILLIILLSKQAFACSNQRINIFIHGIASSKSAFGSFGEFLENEYRKIDTCVQNYYYEYDTGNNKKSIQDFSKGLEDFILRHKLDQENNPISVITHSQGGLVFIWWLKESFEKHNYHSFISNIDSLTTISTPFYGAAIARIGRVVGAYILPILGKIELEQMSFGSLFNYELFKFLTRNEEVKSFFSRINFLDTGAIIPQNGFIKKYLDTKVLEGDTAVAVSSSNLNTISAKFEKNDSWTDLSHYQNLQISAFYPIKAVHGKFTLFGVKSIARVPEKCAKGECDTPLTKLYKHKFFDYSFEQVSDVEDELEKDISSFRVTIYLKSKEKSFYSLDKKFIPENVSINSVNFARSFKLVNTFPDDVKLYSLSFSGAIRDYKINHKSLLKLVVKNSKQKKELWVPIEVNKTSTVELDL